MMASIRDAFTLDLCGGYGSPNNPQFSFSVSHSGDYTISIEVALPAPSGIIFWVNESKTGNRLLSLTSKENPEVARSPYLITGSVKTIVSLKTGSMYIVTPCLQNPNQNGDVTLIVEPSSSHMVVQDLRAVKRNKVCAVRSSWISTLNGGYKSPNNPQFELTVHGTDSSSFSISLIRKDKEIIDGLLFLVVSSKTPGRCRKQIEEKNILFMSKYVASNKVDGVVELSPGSYIIVVCTETQYSTPKVFDLMVESTYEHFEVHVLNMDKPATVPESSCAEIIKSMKYNSTTSEKELPGIGAQLIYYDIDPLDDIIEYCQKNKCKFIDSFFPPNDLSVNWDDGRGKKELMYDQWMRPEDFLDKPEVFIDGVAVEDMLQGYVANCWFCQSLGSLAKRPNLVQRLIRPQKYSEEGVYSIKLFIQGEWRYVIIDDYFPTKNMAAPFATSRDRNELWPMLIEKAFAKTFGSYRALSSRDPGIALRRLSGGETEHFPIQDQIKKDEGKTLWEKLQVYTEFDWIMGLVTKNKVQEETGLVSYHAYSLLKCTEVDGKIGKIKLCQIRNTWGRCEFKGRWSDYDDSGNWTPELKTLLGFENKDDGVFWMDYEDVKKYFLSIYLCKLYEDSLPHSSVFSGKWPAVGGGYKSATNPYVVIQPTNPQTKLFVTYYRTEPELSCGIIGLFCKHQNPQQPWYKENDILAESSYYISDQVSLEVQTKSTDGCSQYRLVPCLEKTDMVNAKYKITVRSDYPIKLIQYA